jgi:alkyl sulfatase BDS1-like metallo-beta-lactamase superfamily hydrolase
MTHPNLYMGAPVELTTLPNGAITHAGSQRQLTQSMYLEPTVDKVAPGVTVFGGDGFLNLTLIEGEGGLIVYDTGEVESDGERFLKQIRSVSDKPIVAILYSHSHYVHGSKQLVGDGVGVKIIGHPQLNTNLALGSSGTTFGETQPLQTSRSMQQFNHYVSRSGPDAAAGAVISFGKSGMLPVNTPVGHGECMCIAGVDMQFFTANGSDTDDCMTVYLPALGVVLNNFLWPFMPNVYTLRASKFRDPRDWRDGLQTILDLAPEVLVNTHARALRGKAVVANALEHVIAALNFTLDQSLRGMLRGLGPEELREFVRLPDELAAHPNLAEVYGEVSHFGPYLYHHALGWFDGDAASINPLPIDEQAQRLVAAMGGRDSVLVQAKQAMEKREYAWATQLLQYLYRLDPTDSIVRTHKADALKALARVTPAHTIRSWYLTHARALQGEVTVPRLRFAAPRVLAMSAPAVSMEQYRVRLDPMRCKNQCISLAIRFSDRDARHAWRVRFGVAEFIASVNSGPAPSLELVSSFDTWLLFFSCRITLDAFMDGTSIQSGSEEQVREFFSWFDYYFEADNSIVPMP